MIASESVYDELDKLGIRVTALVGDVALSKLTPEQICDELVLIKNQVYLCKKMLALERGD